MRLFIALELPEAVRAELTRAQGVLRGHPVRPTGAAGMHLTLQFLGEAGEGLVAPLLGALAAIPPRPIRLRLAGLGGFPTARGPRVVWAGVAGDTVALALLQAAVEAVTAPLGFQAEGRAWRPHLTLGRARRDARPEQLRALGVAVARAAPPAPLVWDAGGPLLFESRLGVGGATYTALGPAGAGAGS